MDEYRIHPALWAAQTAPAIELRGLGVSIGKLSDGDCVCAPAQKFERQKKPEPAIETFMDMVCTPNRSLGVVNWILLIPVY